MNVASQWKNQWHEPLTRKLEIINCSTILVHCDCNNMLKHASVHCDCNHLAATSLTMERPPNFTFSTSAAHINQLDPEHYQLDPSISRAFQKSTVSYAQTLLWAATSPSIRDSTILCESDKKTIRKAIDKFYKVIGDARESIPIITIDTTCPFQRDEIRIENDEVVNATWFGDNVSVNILNASEWITELIHRMIAASELVESTKQRVCNAQAMEILFGFMEAMFLAAIMTMERAITTSDEEGGALLPEQALSEEEHREYQVLPAALLPSR